MNIQRLPNKITFEVTPEFGSKIKSARQQCGLSQKELSNILGLKSATAVSLWESNQRSIDAIDLWKISQVTGLPIQYFI